MKSDQRTTWIKNRFQTMESDEIMTRLADVGRHLALRASLTVFPRRPRKILGVFEFSGKSPEFNGRSNAAPIELAEQVLVNANQWRDHRVSLFSLDNIHLGDSIDWHRDYSSGKTGPMKYSALINHREWARMGDVKYVWELSRLQQLVLLALASKWTGTDVYRAAIHDQTSSWRKQNPFMMGLNWKSPLEAGLRLISWALTAFVLPQWNSEEVSAEWRETIYQHQYFINMFYSKHSSANNHLIGEMAGLYVGSVFWPFYSESARWRLFARRKLIEEIARQVESDGTGKERAIEYQLFILEFFLLAGALGQAIGDPFPTEYWGRISQMAGFLSALSDRNGHLPLFGDGDSGQVVSLPQTNRERVRSVLGMFASSNKSDDAWCGDLRCWLLLWGQTPRDIPVNSVLMSKEGVQEFRDGGYYILSSNRGSADEMIVVFDVGPLGLAPLYAHGHADALSFCLNYAGQEFLIDPGTYCYYSSPRWRSYFRGTGAHNTIRIDQEDQSVSGGTFLWRQPAVCQMIRTRDTDEYAEVVGSHDGYRRLGDPVIHVRGLHLDKKSRVLVITDRIECRRNHEAELFFHFSERCHVQQVGSAAYEVVNDRARVEIQLDSRFNSVLYKGAEDPICGWVSPGFGVRKPSFTLVARAPVTATTEFLTEISGR